MPSPSRRMAPPAPASSGPGSARGAWSSAHPDFPTLRTRRAPGVVLALLPVFAVRAAFAVLAVFAVFAAVAAPAAAAGSPPSGSSGGSSRNAGAAPYGSAARLPTPRLTAVADGARLELPSGELVALPLPPGARLETAAALAGGWIAAGTTPAAPAGGGGSAS